MRWHALIGGMACWGLASICSGQVVVVDTLRSSSAHSRSASTFPAIRVIGEEAVTRSINRNLIVDLLGVDPDTTVGDPLEDLWGKEEDMPQITGFQWSCERPLPLVLMVRLSGEYCGAHCEGFLTHHLFDLRTGSRLEFDGIFTAKGRIAVHDSLARLWRKVITAHVDRLADSLRSPGASGMNNASSEVIEMFRTCLADRSVDDPYVEDMVFLTDRLRFTTARCSDHIARELDDLDPLELDLPRDWLAAHLRPEVREAFGW